MEQYDTSLSIWRSATPEYQLTIETGWMIYRGLISKYDCPLLYVKDYVCILSRYDPVSSGNPSIT